MKIYLKESVIMEKFGLFTILNAINSFLEVKNAQSGANNSPQSGNDATNFSSDEKNANANRPAEQNAYYQNSQSEQKQNTPNFDAKTATLNKNLYPDYSQNNTATNKPKDEKTDGLRFAENVILKHESLSNKLSNKDK